MQELTLDIGNLDDIYDIEISSFSEEYFNKTQLKYLLTKAQSICVGIGVGSDLAAYAIALYRKNSKLGHVYSVAVNKNHRGKGIGTKLLNLLEKKIKDQNLCGALLEVRYDNQTAINLYTKLGYVKTKLVQNYYNDGCTAIKMKKVFQSQDMASSN